MTLEIKKKLDEIERTENVRIIYCIESGSWARGYSVPDSDYDVRFVYVRPVEYYLKLETKRDVIEWQLDDTFDISGWDLEKFLRLTYASNASVYEWAASAAVYRRSPQWERIFSLLPEYFNAKPVIHHCLSSAEGHLGRFVSGEKIRIKKYLHILLPILQCRYMLEKVEYPPIELGKLIDSVSEPTIVSFVEGLLLERQKGEYTERCEELDSYIEKSITEIRGAVDTLPVRERPEWEKLNNCFTETIKAVWGELL